MSQNRKDLYGEPAVYHGAYGPYGYGKVGYDSNFDTPKEFAYSMWGTHKAEILAFLPDATDKGGSSPEFNQWVATHNADAAILCAKWNFGIPISKGPKVIGTMPFSRYWNPQSIQAIISQHTSLLSVSMLDILYWLKEHFFDDAMVGGVFTEFLRHAAINFSDYDIETELYGGNPTKFKYNEWKYALNPNGLLEFGGNISYPIGQGTSRYGGGGAVLTEPVQEIVLGESSYYLWVPDTVGRPSPLEAIQMGGILGLMGKFGVPTLLAYASDIPDMAPLITQEQVTAYFDTWAKWYGKLRQLEASTGIPFSQFRQEPLYLETKPYWGLVWPSPLLTRFYDALGSQTPAFRYFSQTVKEVNTMYANALHGFYSLVTQLNPHFTVWAKASPAAMYNTRAKPYIAANGVSIGDLP